MKKVRLLLIAFIASATFAFSLIKKDTDNISFCDKGNKGTCVAAADGNWICMSR